MNCNLSAMREKNRRYNAIQCMAKRKESLEKNMFPYGFKHGMWRDEDFGPPSKWSFRSGCRYRKKDRRLLHKKARNSLKRELNKEITNMAV